jgi:plastocyanin
MSINCSLKRTSKLAIIIGIAAMLIIASALIVHFRLSETEKSEIESGAEQNEKESPSQIATEILNSLQNKSSSEQNENGEQGEANEQNESVEKTTNPPNTIASQIEISIKELDQVYRWSSANEINPTITFTLNKTNVVIFTNPTDVNHAFIIGQKGKTILESKDIVPGSSGKLSIKPTRIGVFEYHCKYHPDTMKGILNVVS